MPVTNLTICESPTQTQMEERQPAGALSVRRACLSDYPKIAAFITEAYQESAVFKGDARWNWQFVKNPYTRFTDGSVPVWIAELDGKIVGQIAVQEGALEIDGTIHRAGWIVDVMILPSHRGLGLGHRLYSEVAKDCPILVTLTMALATRRMAERIGAINIGDVSLYTRLTHLKSGAVKRYLQMRTAHHTGVNTAIRALCRYFLAHHLVAMGGNLLLSLRDTLVGLPRRSKKTQILETHQFGPDLDAFWRRVSPDFPVAFARDRKFLNWRFFDCPQMRYRCFIASRHGNIVGYVVLREAEPMELPEGIIVDLVAARSDRETIQDLVAFALEFFGTNVAAVQCATSISEFEDVLRTYGFHSFRTERPNCVVSDPAMQQRLRDSSKEWLFSKADHDWDQIHLA